MHSLVRRDWVPSFENNLRSRPANFEVERYHSVSQRAGTTWRRQRRSWISSPETQCVTVGRWKGGTIYGRVPFRAGTPQRRTRSQTETVFFGFSFFENGIHRFSVLTGTESYSPPNYFRFNGNFSFFVFFSPSSGWPSFEGPWKLFAGWRRQQNAALTKFFSRRWLGLFWCSLNITRAFRGTELGPLYETLNFVYRNLSHINSSHESQVPSRMSKPQCIRKFF